jgi:hypothetical protein
MAMGNGTLEQLVDAQYRIDSTALLGRSCIMDPQFHGPSAALRAHPDQLLWTGVLGVFHNRRNNTRFRGRMDYFAEMIEKSRDLKRNWP